MPKTTAAASSTPANYEAMIAEVAYYKAELRSFAPGHEVADWLEAEREVDAMLSGEKKPAAKKSKAKKAVANGKKK